MTDGFADRQAGGKALAAKLLNFKDRADTVVLGLPRGGVPVACEVARALNAPLDIFLVRKLGVPGQEELAFGAIASGGVTVFNESIVRALRLSDSMLVEVIGRERGELERREKLYRAHGMRYDLKGKICIVVDDGLATGATMRAAVAAIRTLHPKQIIVAAPVASRETCDEIIRQSDDMCICAITPEPFYGVGRWYGNFDQTTDAEVIALLDAGEKERQGISKGRSSGGGSS